jgi:long-subunit fatty acid transport protein
MKRFPILPLRIAPLAALVLLLAAPGLAQTGEDVLRYGQRDAGTSVRMAGMAGAGTGGIADFGATVANPAGLALARVSHVTGSLDVTTTASEVQQGGAGTTARATRFAPGHAAYVATVPTRQGAFVVGIGAHRTAALDRRLFAEPSFSNGFSARSEYYESGYVAEVSGVAALEVAPRVYIGASFNGITGDFAYSEFHSLGSVLTSSESFDANLRGFNLRAGVVAETAPGLRLGLSFESPSWIHSEETWQAAGSSAQLFNYSVQTPWRMSGGAVYEVNRLLLALDLVFADWSQARLRPSGTYAEANREIEHLYQVTLDLHLGAEYDFGYGAVRAGYAFAQDPLRDEVATDRLRHTIASGLSYYVQPGVTLDLAFTFTQFDDQVFAPGATAPLVERVGRFRALAGVQFNL